MMVALDGSLDTGIVMFVLFMGFGAFPVVLFIKPFSETYPVLCAYSKFCKKKCILTKNILNV